MQHFGDSEDLTDGQSIPPANQSTLPQIQPPPPQLQIWPPPPQLQIQPTTLQQQVQFLPPQHQLQAQHYYVVQPLFGNNYYIEQPEFTETQHQGCTALYLAFFKSK